MPPAPSKVLLCGMDFGSTTSSFLVAEAHIGRSFTTGRRHFDETAIVFRSESVFTPFRGETIDEAKIAALLDNWIEQSGLTPGDIFAGGAIVTGLAAKRANADALVAIVRLRIGRAVMATADDPCLESWLAFMGSSAPLSRFHSERGFVNLDIGGGTTNPAYGRRGNVLATGCHFIGARHFQFEPGSYRLGAISRYGAALLTELGIARATGDTLDDGALERVLDYYIAGLEAIVRGRTAYFDTPAGRLHQQVPFVLPEMTVPEITFTGGVGELLYRLKAGEALPGTTHYGDLGIDLARKIAASKFLSRSLELFVPETRGRATVYGITLHSTEVSGSSLFLPSPQDLPLYDMPVVARLAADAPPADYRAALVLAGRQRKGACLQIDGSPAKATLVRDLGEKISRALDAAAYPDGCPLVVLTERNIGKALGNYATGWGTRRRNLIVIDEVAARDAHFVNIGAPHGSLVPVSYFGMR
jgi:ethanolamine utilization protein EutA